MLTDVFNIQDATPLSRAEGHARLTDPNSPPANAVWHDKSGQWRVPAIHVRLVGHSLHTGFPRFFGHQHHEAVFRPLPGAPDVALSGRKRLTVVAQGRNFSDYAPIVEFIETSESNLYAIRLETVDTMLPFGSGSLDHLSKVFLGVGKSEVLTRDEKEHMRDTFLRRPNEAFGYALRDAALTLVLYENMVQRDRAMYTAFGISPELMGRMKSTLGSRVAEFVFAATRQSLIGCTDLSNPRTLKRLMREGGIGRFERSSEGSHFGAQTGAVHGGLQFSRTPTVFWHEAPGMLRDIDLKSCYPRIASRINVYWGRPILVEPGNRRMRLHEAVSFARQHADDDAWMIRVSGEFSQTDNVLIPSTLDALTWKNFRRHTRSGRTGAGLKSEPAVCETPRFHAKLFSRQVDSGVVTSMTWTMIEALPEQARQEYGDLIVDAIVLYPRELIADSGEDYARLCDALRRDGLRWSQKLDLTSFRRTEVVQLDHEDVALKFSLADLTNRLTELRQDARNKHGAGSGAELNWKLTSNAVLGVLGSPHLATGNPVAANVITAHARAVGFALFLALNGLQLITDGCVYRRDRIPRCTFRECLQKMSDYPLRHADPLAGIDFFQPEQIPEKDADFDRWLWRHIRRFFGLDQTAAERLLIHQVEHKLTPETGASSYDALACDGCANQLKLTQSDGEWDIYEMKLRGYGESSKRALMMWLADTYAKDRITELAPITVDRNLPKLVPAANAARRILKGFETEEVLLPLGFECETVRAYKVLKPSAFVFQTPKQYAAIERQLERLYQQTGCGLDLLVLRRTHAKRPGGSLSVGTEKLYAYINSGGRDLVKTFNLRKDRLSQDLLEQVEVRREERSRRVSQADDRLAAAISVTRIEKKKPLTGILMRLDDEGRLGPLRIE